MTFSLDPHSERVEMNNSIVATLASNTNQENPVPLVENHSHTVHVSRKRAVILLELLNSVAQKASFSPVLQVLHCLFCGYKAKLARAMSLRCAVIKVYPYK